MIENYYAGVYWGARRETAAECARRTEVIFRELARCDPSFDRWHTHGKSGSSPRAVRTNGLQDLEDIFLCNKFRYRGEVAEALGFMLKFWNKPTDGTDIDLRCGSYASHVVNMCAMNPPSENNSIERLFRAPVLKQILSCMIIAWEPDWGVARSHKVGALIPQDEEEPYVGWFTYLSRRRGTVPPLPAPVRIEPVENKGTLITLTPERLTVNNPEHVRLAIQVRNLLARAKLLGPMPEETRI
jgi:hypothetical protein